MPSMALPMGLDLPRPVHPCTGARRDEGEAELSPMPLTGIGPAERVQRFLLHPGPPLSVFVCFRLALYLLAAGAHLGQHGVYALLVDGAQPLARQAQRHPAFLALHPQAAILQIGQEAAAGPVVRMRHVITRAYALARHLTYSRHRKSPKYYNRLTCQLPLSLRERVKGEGI